MNIVLRFDEAGSDEKSLVDGKAINLGRCAQAGFPVPVGFTVPTEAEGAFHEVIIPAFGDDIHITSWRRLVPDSAL
jgi:phosphoenolpyruvate synthase/pyruvate phosphate dikinase